MAIKLWHIILIILFLLILAYIFIPIVRYYLIPITGGTKAPKSLTTNTSETGYKAQPSTEKLLYNQIQQVFSIKQVPIEGGWINSEPLNLESLYKKRNCILIDFWTFSCINCIRATPYTQELWDRYKDYGLIVIGVHSPEFDFEREPKKIEKANITYPVLTDGDMKVWRKFGNHFWPGKYIIHKGIIIHTQFGEGGYEKEEEVIIKCLENAGWSPPDFGPTPKFLEPLNKHTTPELYAGPKFIRQPYGNKEQPQEGQIMTFKLPSKIDEDKIYLSGTWFASSDYIESKSDGKIVLNYIASTPYIVLVPRNENTTPKIEVLLDDHAIPSQYQGKDIIEENGKTFLIIDQARLYYPLAETTPYKRRIITFNVPAGVHFYSFTFGAY
jgi:thiol-disulfide isomerase/thioredoxin